MKTPENPDCQTSEAVIDLIEDAIAESHVRWTAGHTADPQDYRAYKSPLRRYEARHVAAALDSLRSSSGWVRISREYPEKDRSVLVRLELVGPVYDVAVYAGRSPSGEHRWILADISLDPRLITHWSAVHEPAQDET